MYSSAFLIDFIVQSTSSDEWSEMLSGHVCMDTRTQRAGEMERESAGENVKRAESNIRGNVDYIRTTSLKFSS